MRVELLAPLTVDAKIRVTYNGTELFTRDFSSGDTPVLDFETPKRSGRAVATLICEDVETEIGSATYSFRDVAGAKLVLDEARAFYDKQNFRSAYAKGREAVRILEDVAPDSNELADAYLFVVFTCFSMKSRPKNREQTRTEALDWYQKALAVWKRNGNLTALCGNLTNVSAMYFRFGQINAAVTHAELGLKLAKKLARKNLLATSTQANSEATATQANSEATADDEAIAAWTHCASYNLSAGNIDRAERIAKDGLKRFPNDPNRAHLLHTCADVLEARAQKLREQAEALSV